MYKIVQYSSKISKLFRVFFWRLPLFIFLCNENYVSNEILDSNIIEKKDENEEKKKTCSNYYNCSNEEDVENDSKPIYNQTVFIKHLLDHYKQNPDSTAALIGKMAYL